MSGFGAEFKSMRNQGGAPKLTEEAVKSAETAVAESKASEPTGGDPDAATFAQPFMDGQETEVQSSPDAPSPIIIPPPKTETKKAIKINGKSFETTEEAIEYAAELERALDRDEAYKKGLAAANPPPATPAEVKKIKKIADRFFEDPESAMEELEQHMLEMTEKRLSERESKKTEEQQRAERMKQDVDNFYKTNSDLVEWQDEVDLVAARNFKMLSELPKDQIAGEVARLSREYVSSVRERALPRSALNSKPAQTSNGGTKSTTATQNPATEKKLSFAGQVRSTNKRTVMQGDT